MKHLDDPSIAKNFPDFRNALGTQYVCDAVLESAETGQWVDVKRA
jgi:predicted dehydrogenase